MPSEDAHAAALAHSHIILQKIHPAYVRIARVPSNPTAAEPRAPPQISLTSPADTTLYLPYGQKLELAASLYRNVPDAIKLATGGQRITNRLIEQAGVEGIRTIGQLCKEQVRPGGWFLDAEYAGGVLGSPCQSADAGCSAESRHLWTPLSPLTSTPSASYHMRMRWSARWTSSQSCQSTYVVSWTTHTHGSGAESYNSVSASTYNNYILHAMSSRNVRTLPTAVSSLLDLNSRLDTMYGHTVEERNQWHSLLSYSPARTFLKAAMPTQPDVLPDIGHCLSSFQ